MKKIYIILLFLFSVITTLEAQEINEGFESGTLNPFISFQSVGTFASAPGIIINTDFGSTQAFSFGRSTCGSNCFTNYTTTLSITFPHPTYVDSIMWKEMETLGNWGSQGLVLLDNVPHSTATLGAQPINSNLPDATPRNQVCVVNQTVTTIQFVVSDITSASEIVIDDLFIGTNIDIVGYEYWFNNDFANKTNTSVTATQQLNVNQNIATTGLADGINVFNFRSYDNFGQFSAVLSEFFYKMPASTMSSSNLVAYEYWFNNDYANAITVNTAVQGQVNINELISAQNLADGIQVFNIRFKDSKDMWSSVSSEFFYKMPVSVPTTSTLVAYEYWFNNDYANAVTVNTAVQSQVSINELIDAQLLNNGIHIFNIRFKDNMDLWSSTMTEFFYKMPVQTLSNNLITNYRYWLNDDFAQAVNVSLPMPVEQFSLIDNLDFTQIPKGQHTIHFQFKDTLNFWSSVSTDTINKIALPIADFSFSTTVACDSTIVQFTDLSIDGDIYLWDFGDGNSDTSANPSHVYYSANTYQVSLTVTDTASGIDSVKVAPIIITILSTESSISETVCDMYTAPDGQIYTTSGIKTAVIPNTAGCDSTITIDLTILNSTTSSISETVCDSYTAADGQIYATSGIKTAVIPNTAGCDSTITIDLTILNSTTSSISETVCDTYTAPDGQIYTTSGIKTVVITNIAGCDSTITIDLTILNSTTSSISETVCDTYTAPDGQIYTTSGIKTAVISNTAGCDSTITIDLTILNSTTSSINETVCDSYLAPDGQIYSTSGIKTAVIPNTAGCDSTITIDLTILNSTTSSISETVCDSYTAADGQIYTTSGIKTAVISNTAGCDSTINIDLTILNSTSSSISETVCDTYTAADGQIYTTSGIKTAVIPNTAGCDSTITIDLTINQVDVSVTQNGATLSANEVGANYQWLDCDNGFAPIVGETKKVFTATQNGSYAVEISQNNCTSISTCFTVTGVGVLDLDFESEVVLFPNPTEGNFSIDLGSNYKAVKISVIDLNGKLVYENTYNNSQLLKLSLKEAAGVYLVKVASGAKQSVIRLVIE